MSSMTKITDKPSIFVTRRWPAAAEEALKKYFNPTFNIDDIPLTADQIAEGFATHQVLATSMSRNTFLKDLLQRFCRLL